MSGQFAQRVEVHNERTSLATSSLRTRFVGLSLLFTLLLSGRVVVGEQPPFERLHERYVEQISPEYNYTLEQYDVIGRLRLTPVDTSTKVIEGQTIDGIDGLRDYLLNDRRDDIVRQFCRKLLGYSLDREVLLSDRPLLDTMMSDLAQHEYRFSVAVESIVLSDQFQKIRGTN